MATVLVATAPTVYGIGTRRLNRCTLRNDCFVAIAPIIYDIETIPIMIKIAFIFISL